MVTKEARRILEDIEHSGLPCEIEVTSKLRNSRWMIFNQSAYIDEDTGVLRYADLEAVMTWTPQLTLVVECCKSEKPWSFYGSWKRSWLPSIVPPHLPREGFRLQALQACCHQKAQSVFEATIPYEPFKAGKGRDIFDASMKVLKALRYTLSDIEDFERKQKLKSSPRVYYPVIVFDGHLYALLLRTGRILPSRTEYLRYDIAYKDRQYLIDIVSRTYFGTYLELIHEELLEWKKFGSAETLLDRKESGSPL